MNNAFFGSPIAIGSHRGIVLSDQPAPTPNTLEAFTHPNNQNATYIECDLQLDPNNNIVLQHDPIDPKNPPQTLLSLDDFLTAFQDSQKKLYIELKYYETDPKKKETLVTRTLNTLINHKAENKSAIASFDADLLNITHQHTPNIPLILNLDLHNVLSKAYKLTQIALTHPINQHLSYIAPPHQRYPKPQTPSVTPTYLGRRYGTENL